MIVFNDGIYGFFGEHRFLSNFWYADVTYDGDTYSSVEHGYQAAKCAHPVDRIPFLQSTGITPAQAKRQGKHVKLRDDWELVKIAIMRDLVFQKFQHEDLRDRLIATGDKYLEETNTWGDTFWGVCNGNGLS